MISFDDFKKVEIKIGEILFAKRVENTDRLVCLTVDMNEDEPRQIISGIAEHFPDVSELVGVKCAFVANLEPRTIRGLESQGMILAVSTDEGGFSLLESGIDIPAGTLVS